MALVRPAKQLAAGGIIRHLLPDAPQLTLKNVDLALEHLPPLVFPGGALCCAAAFPNPWTIVAAIWIKKPAAPPKYLSATMKRIGFTRKRSAGASAHRTLDAFSVTKAPRIGRGQSMWKVSLGQAFLGRHSSFSPSLFVASQNKPSGPHAPPGAR